MSELRDIVRALAGPLEVEAREGYPDAAVIGQSIGEYARGWAARAREALEGRSARGVIARIERALAHYGERGTEERRRRVEEALGLLRGLGDGKRARARQRQAGGEGRQAASAKASAPRAASAEDSARGASFDSAGDRPAERGRAGSGRRQAAARQRGGAGLDEKLAVGRLKQAGWLKKLAKLGIETRRDLLYHFPRDYSQVKRIADLADGERAAVVGTACEREEAVAREGRGSRLMRYALCVSDESGSAWVTSFARVPRRGKRSKMIAGSPLALNYQEGTRLLIEGTVRRSGRLIEIQYSGSERLGEGAGPAAGSLAPLYPLTDGVYQGQVRSLVRRILADLPADLEDPLPERLRAQHDLVKVADALRDIHWPNSQAAVEAARRRVAFEELLTLQLALAQRKREMAKPGSGISMRPRGDMVAMLEELLPFSLTRAQQRAIAEIVSDMAVDTPMSRMLQGDVGSGKTVVAAAALLVAIQSGRQGALMAPTELLAEQHYLVLDRMLDAWGVRVELLTGSVRGKERERALRYIAGGRAQVIIGTHALIQEAVGFESLGLVIVDEQHRFGVRQRAKLRTKGEEPDLLVMTATPIPRTLALTLYGDLEMSVLDEMPPGRRPVQTSWLPSQRQVEAFEFVREQVKRGRQAYIVCPLIEESEALQAEAATELAEKLRSEVFRELRVGLLHGAMGVAEKDAAMEAFRAGELDVLCSTTVVEVGVDVPNASVMVILSAERFGLAQVHQLRGRVGRGSHESQCILVSDRRSDPTGWVSPMGDDSVNQTRRRLRVLLETTDGFRIAEEDLLLRGPGEFYGTRQHGMPDFRLARLARDLGVLEEAREAAFDLIARDPELRAADHRPLRRQVSALRARMDAVAG